MIARYVRFTVTKMKGSNNIMQFSKLYLYLNSNIVLWNASATTSSDFDFAAAVGEKSLNIIKNTGIEKWCVVNVNPPISVVIDNLSAISIDSYAYITGNDSIERDPVSWTFEASIDNSNWELVSSKLDEDTTTLRNTSTQLFSLYSYNQLIYYKSSSMLMAC